MNGATACGVHGLAPWCPEQREGRWRETKTRLLVAVVEEEKEEEPEAKHLRHRRPLLLLLLR